MHDHDDPEKCSLCSGVLADLKALEQLPEQPIVQLPADNINAAVLQFLGTASA